jgi:hypothetical protein
MNLIKHISKYPLVPVFYKSLKFYIVVQKLLKSLKVVWESKV